MSAPEDGCSSPRSQLSSHVFGDLLDAIFVDVASECHRIARLGLDRNLEEEEEGEELRLSAQARVADASNNSETNTKNAVDIFGQRHPAIASEIFDCMNCGRPIVAGRFAPHLEKCMGKGRRARLRDTRSIAMAQSMNYCGGPIAVYAPYCDATNRVANRNDSVENTKIAFEET